MRRKSKASWFDVDDSAKQTLATDKDSASLVDTIVSWERHLHEHGWDDAGATPALYTLDRAPRSPGNVGLHWSPELSVMLFQGAQSFGGAPGPALEALGNFLITRRFEVGREIVAQPGVGRELYGMAYSQEAWWREVTDDTDESVPPSQDPNRVEMRFVWVVVSTGLVWYLERHRGSKPVVYLADPVSRQFGTSGRVPAGLARLYNAVADNPVPVPAED